MKRFFSFVASVLAVLLTVTMAPAAAFAESAPTTGSLQVQMNLPAGYEAPEGMAQPNRDGVIVRLIGEDFEFERELALDANGVARFDALPEGRYALFVTDIPKSDLVGGFYEDGILMGEMKSPQPFFIDAEAVSIQADFRRGAMLRGTVVNASGDPVASAQVSRDHYFGTPVETDTNGQFELALPPGQLRVWVDAPEGSSLTSGYWTGSGTPVVGDYSAAAVVAVSPSLTATPNDIEVMLVAGGTLTGYVLNADGAPVQGAEFQAMSGMRTTTAADGFFSLSGLRAGSEQIRISADDPYVLSGWLMRDNSISSGHGGDSFQVTSGLIQSLGEIRLPAAGAIHGTVVDLPEGYRAWASVSHLSNYGHVASMNVDADGSFTVGNLPAGDYEVQVMLWAPNGTFTHVVESARVSVTLQETTNIELIAVAGGSLSGRILDSSGQPVTSGYISASGQYSGQANLQDDGTFSITGLAAGEYSLSLHSGGITRSLSQAVEAALGVDTDLGEIRLGAGAHVSILVQDPEGQPVSSARVYGSGENGAFSAETDEYGNAEFNDIEPGDYLVSLWHGGASLSVGSFTVTPEGASWVLTMKPSVFAAITATLDGVPAGNRPLLIEPVDGSQPPTHGWTDDAGIARIPLLTGEYDVTLATSSDSWWTQWAANPTRTIAVGEDSTQHVLDFGADLQLDVSVQNAQGEGVAYADVYAEFNNDSSTWFSADANGRLTLDGLSSGDYRLSTYVDQEWVYYGGTADAEAATIITLSEAQRTYFAMISPNVAGYASVSGRITDAQGEPIADEHLMLDVSNEEDSLQKYATTNSDGEYAIYVPFGGAYTLWASTGASSV
ncbi:MAG: carboxypeptidase regulatory-like domain-containing protein, partial [Microbacteriaceae bacterium]|nr:carboxypeptidase regulatory-like domain-containing protein [Microbacteriaceae bacterium]